MEITVKVYTGRGNEEVRRKRLRAAYLRAKEIQAQEPDDVEIFIEEVREDPPPNVPSSGITIVRDENA